VEQALAAVAAVLVGQVSAQVSAQVLAQVLAPGLAAVPNSSMALCSALAPDQRTTSNTCRRCTKG